MATKKKTSKSIKINPWMVTSIVLLILLAGFISYDKSTTFQNLINNTFGIETGPGKIGLTIITDEFIDNPAYDINENMETLQTEIGREFKVETVDISTEKGLEYIEKHNLKTIPVLIFDKKITETDFYKEASSFFTQEGELYIVKLQPYKYLDIPTAGDAHYKGGIPGSAPVTIIEYSSFTCPYCAKMKPIIYQALEEYGDKISYVYKHFDRGGSDGLVSNASECAGDQGKFWEMHEYIMDNQSAMREKDIMEFLNEGAIAIELNKETFDLCVQENKFADKIKAQTKEGSEFGISGTPSFFINDQFVGGAVEYEKIKTIIDSIIK